MKRHISNFKLKFIIGLFVYWIICLFPSLARADGLSIGVYPPITKIEIPASNTIDNQITLQNFSDNPVDLKIVVKPFTSSSSQNGTVSFLENASESELVKKFLLENVEVRNENNIPITEIQLAPKQKRSILLHITIPKDQQPQDYYFSLVFISNDLSVTNANESVLFGGIATNVLVSAGTRTAPKGFLAEFSGPSLVEKGPITFHVKLTNDSTFFIQPQGRILIQNAFGQIVGKVDLLPVTVLAQSSRYLPDDRNNSLIDAIWPESFLIGPYTATVTVALSDKGPVYERSIHFFAIPWQFITGLIIVVCLIVFIVIRVRKKLKTIYR